MNAKTTILTAAFICVALAASAQDNWSVEITGIRTGSVTVGQIKESFDHRGHEEVRKLERKGSVSEYRGIPLSDLVAMADGEDGKHPYIFDEDLWSGGYDITLVASDGYAATFSTADVPPNAIMVAIEKDGRPIAPMIAGDVPGNLWIKELVAIELGLAEMSEEPALAPALAPAFRLVFEAGDIIEGFSIPELESSEYYIEDEGKYTTSAGTTYSHIYGGVDFAEMLKRYVRLEPDTVVTVVASDGYEMSYSGEQLLSEDGQWLAFKQDGEYLPMDPGYFRTVKIGADIDGHLSARMVERIIVEGAVYRPFELIIEGRADAVLDRQTIQSGVSCHRQEVSFLNKKTGEVSVYEGIPLWRLLAYGDDPEYAPHHQDKKILSYDAEAAENGYGVRVIASDGFERMLNSSDLHMNDAVIIALYKDGEELPERDQPLILVWDKDAETIPEGIKSIRNIVRIVLEF